MNKYKEKKVHSSHDLKRLEEKIDMKFLATKLFTKEDEYFIHKSLGLGCLISYCYRYFYLLPRTGSLGFERGGLIDYGTLLLHGLLSCSSLIFHVLERRISNKPMIIWEEYRLHAIVFSLKAICGSLFGINLSIYYYIYRSISNIFCINF